VTRFCQVYTHPDGGLRRGILFTTLSAALLGDPNFGGVCPGYKRVGFAARVPGGWWRMKDQVAPTERCHK
jgi:hypothetical protein